MAVRAKFRCQYVAEHDTDETVYFVPVYEDQGVNKRWSEATPAGTLQMTITNKGARGAFTAGKEYYVDITQAD